jgi:hypothetical protein
MIWALRTGFFFAHKVDMIKNVQPPKIVKNVNGMASTLNVT